MEIRLVKNEALDKVKWNSCVHYAVNGNVFGYKWYLDCLSKEWDALVEGDYESVLPLFHSKSGYSGYFPSLLNESGIYSIHLLSQKRMESFIEAVPEGYEGIGIQYKNGIRLPQNHNFDVQQKNNYRLSLQSPYDTLRSNFSEPLKSSLENSKRHKLKPVTNLKPEKIADLFKENSSKSGGLKATFHAYQRIMYNALHRGWGFATGIVNEKDTLLTAAFFVFTHGTLLTLLSPESAEGKRCGARNLLFDYFIRNNAGRPLILDFNTEDGFPEGFGALQKKSQQISRKEKKWWNVF